MAIKGGNRGKKNDQNVKKANKIQAGSILLRFIFSRVGVERLILQHFLLSRHEYFHKNAFGNVWVVKLCLFDVLFFFLHFSGLLGGLLLANVTLVSDVLYAMHYFKYLSVYSIITFSFFFFQIL